jgi:His/Glu/Gln/Arg/opine family amino acid ABC transporter permease subunit
LTDTSLYLSDWLFILKGLGITLFLCICSIGLGSIFGIIQGVMRTSKIKMVSYLAWTYVYFIRGTPLLMQLFLVYYGLPIILGYSIPAFSTALIGLSLYTTAYIGEIVKAGLQSVDIGQREASKALGMTSAHEFIHIVFPQTLTIIVPNAVGFFIALIKDSSLVSAIGFMELTRSSRFVIARTFQPFTVYIIVALIYFIVCFGMSKLSKKVEERLDVYYGKS